MGASEWCPTATLSCPKFSLTLELKPSSCLLPLAGRKKPGWAGPGRKLPHKVPLYGAGLWETNERDFKINGKLFLSREGLKCLYFPSWKSNLKGSLCCRVCFHLLRYSNISEGGFRKTWTRKRWNPDLCSWFVPPPGWSLLGRPEPIATQPSNPWASLLTVLWIFQTGHLLVPAPPADPAALHWLPSAFCIWVSPTQYYGDQPFPRERVSWGKGHTPGIAQIKTWDIGRNH